MSEDILGLVLHAENEYQSTMHAAEIEAKNYADDSINKQRTYQKELESEWATFEKAAQKAFEQSVLAIEQEMKKKAAKRKESLRLAQQSAAESISERLKKEVLALYGSR